MTIAQALKLKNKTAVRLNKLWQRFHASNSHQEGEEATYFAEDLWKEINDVTAELISLKTRIHTASEPIRADIFHISELKSTIQNLRGLSTQKGTIARYDNTATYVCTYDTLWKDTQMDVLEAKIEELQERMDKFNHTTNI